MLRPHSRPSVATWQLPLSPELSPLAPYDAPAPAVAAQASGWYLSGLMPALDQKTVDDLTERLERYLSTTGGADEIQFLASGGSAAVFRVTRHGGTSAVKAFDPALFSGPGGAADRRRLDVQRRLIGHSCPSLVQTYRIDEAEGTAFIEMEFVDWPQLAKRLQEVPDEAIVPLIGQLVDAVRYLEGLNIVHRDIKPENIHVSPDFMSLKLLDLGVAREFDSPDESEAAITDTGGRRPFLATAQYSSPDYLFRLDEPTAKLWRGLNFYQVGAVLHDLIKKEALFQHEVAIGNAWLPSIVCHWKSFNTVHCKLRVRLDPCWLRRHSLSAEALRMRSF